MRTNWFASAVVISTLVVASGCKENAPASSKSSGASEGATSTQAVAAAGIDSAKAKEIFGSRCAACHGPEGRGDGPGAAALNPKPRNYHDKEWQSKVSDEDIKKTITYGGAAVGKSPIMPGSPDLEAKPEVMDGLVKLVREFGKS